MLGKETGVLLEYGSGTGELLAACQEKGWECTGVEPEEKARKKAQQNHKLELIDTGEKIDFRDNSVDRIMMWHVLEHIPDLHGTLSNFKRWLKKEGLMLIAVPNIDDYGHWKGSRKAVDEYFELDKNFMWLHRIDYASRILIKK